MPQFLKSLTGAFLGKLLAVLFVAICVLFGFGPEKWAAFMIQELPLWLTPRLAQGSFIALAAITFLLVFKPWNWFLKSPTTPEAKITQGVPQEIIEVVKDKESLQAVRDTEMHFALGYVETGKWGIRFVDIVMKPGPADKGFSPATVRQAAIDGEIRVWGRTSQNGPYVLIPAGYWEVWQIDWYSAWVKCHTEIAETGHYGGTKHYDLMVSKAEIEKKWPPT